LAGKFSVQPPNRVPHFSLEQLIRYQLTNDGRVASDLENYDSKYNDIEFWVKEKKYYYDPGTKYFYLSEKDCEKFNGKSVAKNLQGEILEAVGKLLDV